MNLKAVISIALPAIVMGISIYIYAYTPSEWSLPWVEIVPREERITNESVIYKTSSRQESWYEESWSSNTPNITSVEYIRNTHLGAMFGKDYRIDARIQELQNKFLLWPRSYKKNKTHIVIHHTASDNSKLETPEQAKANANGVFLYHTLTNQRGDIGYNFLIDPRGTIYEGKWGWKDVVGAHARYNNESSIGIALMGNFEINEVSQEQYESLIKLSTALAALYGINPTSEVYSHIQNHESPYVKDIITPSVIGHRDTWVTACPWEHLYVLMSQIKEDILQNLATYSHIPRQKKERKIINSPKSYFLESDTNHIVLPLDSKQTIIRCTTNAKNVLVECTPNTSPSDTLEIFIRKKNSQQTSDSQVAINLTTKWANSHNLRTLLSLERLSDKNLSMQEKKQAYLQTHPLPSPKLSEKFNNKIPATQAQTLSTKPIKVLLYDLSMNMNRREFFCQNCDVQDNAWNYYTDKSFSIVDQWSHLEYIGSNGTWTLESITITPKKNEWTSIILNYDRSSFAGIPRNSFYGSIEISQQKIKNIDSWWLESRHVLINTLPLELYLRGIAETNDTEPIEKNKVMSLLAKNYILFYLDEAHQHPSVPDEVNYNAIDDARSFQKYVGAWLDHTLTKRKQALESTNNEIITYQNNLAFLPYFSCSAWFTRSAKEKYWRTDTPYLQSVYDPNPCDDFAWHGVGLAGQWASYMANRWSTYKDIITYFYSGVEITTY